VPVSATDTDTASITLDVTAVTSNADNSAATFYTYTPDATPVAGKQASGTIEFTPGTGDEGVYTVELTADDGENPPVVLTFELTVLPPLNVSPEIAPIANQTMNENDVLDVPVSATDADSDPVTITVTVSDGAGWFSYSADTPPAGGTQASGTISFTPPTGSAGTYTVTVTAEDGISAAATGTFSLFVAEENVSIEAPQAVSDVGSIQPGNTLFMDVLANDTYTGEISNVTIAIVDAPTQGSAVPGAGIVEYTANAAATGSDSFTYTITDETGLTSNVATVTVAFSVNGASLFVDVVPKSQQVPYNGTAIFEVSILNNGNQDLQGITLDDSGIEMTAALGSMTATCDTNLFDLVAGARLDVTCENEFVTQSFTRTFVVEHSATQARSEVSANVESVANQPPQANDDSATVLTNENARVEVLANDSDSDGELDVNSLRVVTDRVANAGDISVANGRINVRPADEDFTGTLTLDYEICDDGGLCDTATVTVTVQSRDDNGDNGGDTSDDNTDTQIETGGFTPAISKLGLGAGGGQIEWVITVRNTGTDTGYNVSVSDTVRSGLQIDRVEMDKGSYAISGQTVTLTIGTLAPGEVVQIRLFTTVLNASEQMTNTACVSGAGVDSTCVTAPAVSVLPSTGESPWSALRPAILAMLAAAGLLTGLWSVWRLRIRRS
jgi:hypothetical protein